MKRRRSAVMLVRRSHADSGRSTSPTLEASSTPFSISGRTGGSSWLAVAACRLAIVLRLLFLDLIGEQHVADLHLEGLHPRIAHRGVVELMPVQLRLPLSRLRRHPENAVADDQRLLDRKSVG